tara:strand:+ start:1716 stop:3371 length:1656 start_codon:yes stop_codon:yes gene_type:complete
VTLRIGELNFCVLFPNKKIVPQYQNMLAVPTTSRPSNASSDLPSFATTVPLTQADFTNGTYRITSPGSYVLTEDIVFEPADFTPSGDQYSGGAYHLGFFAAITIETSNVLLNLNGFTLSQSKLHHLQQRFFALIELADQPFLPSQGPSHFGDELNAASSVWIVNGILGKSSHHGIHGNNNRDIHIQNICVEDFEVAGIALNGCKDVTIEQCRIGPSSQNVPVSAAYSQARFLLPILKQVTGTLPLRSGVTAATVLADLETRMEATKTQVMAGEPVTDEMFALPGGLTDGAVVGIQIHSPGVAINGFQKDWERGSQTNIVIKNCHIQRLNAKSVEVVAYNKLNPDPALSYASKKVQSGIFGAVLRFERIMDADGTYKPDPLTDGLFAVWRHFGKGNIDDLVWQWAMKGADFHTLYPVLAGDSMHHVMKGNIGIFLSGCKIFTVDNVTIESILNQGAMSAVHLPNAQFHSGMNMPRYNGNMCRGMMLATCFGGLVKNVSIKDLYCMQPPIGIETFGPTGNVVVENPTILMHRGVALLGKGIVQQGDKKAMHWH